MTRHRTGWRRELEMRPAVGGDAAEVWTSPRGRAYDVRVRHGKSVDPLAIKGSDEAFAKELQRVRSSVEWVHAHCELESVASCPICASPRRTSGVVVHGIAYVVCSDCSHAYTERRLRAADLATYYGDSSEYVPVHVNAATAEARIDRVAMPKIDLVIGEFQRLHRRAPESLLDVGAGAGHIVAAAKRKGLRAAGLEPSRVGRGAARELFGLELVGGDLISYPDTEGPFDIISMWGVIEHTIDPSEHLARVRHLLSTSGMLFLEVPRYNSLSTTVEAIFPDCGTRHLEGIEHIHCFTDASLATLLETAGFAPSFVWYLGLDWYEFAMRTSLLTGERGVATAILGHYDALQMTTDSAGLADGMIVGAVVEPRR